MTNILITTTPIVENRPVREYLGIVSGEAFMRRWWLYWKAFDYDPDTLDTVNRDNIDPALDPTLYLAVDDWADFKAKLHKAQNWAIRQMAEEAASLGANAVIGVKIDYKTVNGHRKEEERAIGVIATGTAVRL